MSDSDQAAKTLQAKAIERWEAARRHAFILVDKLLQSYVYETKPCFCGEEGETEFVDSDRMGLPHRMVVCKKCALIRANPRLTKESYNRFYNEDYRLINHLRSQDERLAGVEDDTQYFILQQQKGLALKKTLDDFQLAIKPQVVVDYGCHLGGISAPWLEDGAEVWGIEVDEGAAKGARANGLKVVSSIDELIQKGVKADLVIMQDIIEHLLDLKSEMQKVGSILNRPHGVLYVWTPGFFKHEPKNLWQLAHTYQFCCATLEYVMDQCGFTPYYCDEEIKSFWRYEPELEHSKAPPTEWIEYEADSAFGNMTRKLPPFRGFCKFSRKELYEHVEQNLKHGYPDLGELLNSEEGDVVVLAAGPSVDSQMSEIKNLVASGAKVVSIGKMFRWAINNGITPDYVVALDSMPDQLDAFLGELPDKTTYLLGNVAYSKIFDALEGKRCFVWDSRDDIEFSKRRLAAGYTRCTVINTGSSVSITSISLASFLGFKRFHIFGFDCMVPSREYTHSQGVSGTSVVPAIFEVEVDGEMILTSGSWIEFARQGLRLVDTLYQQGVLEFVKFYGESLCNKLWDGKWVDNVQPQ